MVSVDCQSFCFFFMLVSKFDGILLFKNPLNIIFKTVKSNCSGTSSHFSGKISSAEQNLCLRKLAHSFFLALSLFVSDTEEYLWRDCCSSLILKGLTIPLTICVWTVKCTFWVFLEHSNGYKSFLVISMYGCSALGVHQWLYQVVLVYSLFLAWCYWSKS